LVGPRQQRPAGLGQIDFPTQPVEQPHTQLLLQTGDAFADRRLSQVQAIPGPGKAAHFGDGNKGIETGQVHEPIPFGYPKYENYEFELFKITP